MGSWAAVVQAREDAFQQLGLGEPGDGQGRVGQSTPGTAASDAAAVGGVALDGGTVWCSGTALRYREGLTVPRCGSREPSARQ